MHNGFYTISPADGSIFNLNRFQGDTVNKTPTNTEDTRKNIFFLSFSLTDNTIILEWDRTSIQ